MAMSSASVVDCAAICLILVMKYMIHDVALAFSGLPLPCEPSQKLVSFKLLFRL